MTANRAEFNQAAIPLMSDQSAFKEYSFSRWNVNKNAVTYKKLDGHTLSLYLTGGENSYRSDQKSLKGGQGKICLMPAKHESKWEINDSIDFVHFYFSDKFFKDTMALNFDVDVRHCELRDLLYIQNDHLKHLITQIFRLNLIQQHPCELIKEQVLNDLMHQLIVNSGALNIQQKKHKGGLSYKQINQVREFIGDQLGENISLNGMASNTNLSPFHFAKMFKLSFGETPAQYILKRRLKRSKELLTGKQSLAEISFNCGFSHQSHMTSVFKKHFGITPKQFRQN